MLNGDFLVRLSCHPFERKRIAQWIKDNPYSLGVFGKNDTAEDEDFIKYGLVGPSDRVE